MQITQTNAEGLKREFRITVAAADIETRVAERLKHLGHTVQLPGFRPGKVPMALLRKRFGNSVMGEVLEDAVNAGSQKAMVDHKLTPAAQPKIEVTKFAEGQDLEYTMAIEVMPEIAPADFSKIELERLTVAVSESEIEEALTRMAEGQKSFQSAETGTAAAIGHAVMISFVGSVDGKEFEGGKGEDFLLELGSKRFIPGFEEQLVGVKAGDDLTVQVTFPEDYGAKDLAGKAASFAVAVKEVRVPQTVAVDDELAKRMGLENLAALRKAVSEQISRDYIDVSRARLKRSLLDKLAEQHNFVVPQGMIDAEIGAIVQQFRDLREKGGLDPDEKEKTEDQVRDEYRPIAERRVRLGLLLGKVGEMNNITVNDNEVSRALSEQSRRFPGRERQVVEFYQNNAQAMASLKAPLYEDKVVDFILELAKLSDRSVAREELMRDPDAEPAAAAQDDKTETPAAGEKKPAKRGAKKAVAKD